MLKMVKALVSIYTKDSLKLSRNKKDLNEVTAAPFLVSFSQLPAAKKTEKGAAVMSIRSFLLCEDFNNAQSQELLLLRG